MPTEDGSRIVPLPVEQPVWDRVFTVAPLIIVGSQEANGSYNLAPKHLATPLGWDNFYSFVCSPRHSTYHNIRRIPEYTISFPRPTELVTTSLAAAPRCEDLTKPSLLALKTVPASMVQGVLVQDCYFFLECRLHSIIDGFGRNSLVIGEVVAAAAREDALRMDDRDEADQINQSPLMVYLSPGRYAEIHQSGAFPFPKGYTR
jgi:flavin reductase (DIM6/NTAB) family NADH-FMN oxidoreductase RutF